MLIGQRHKVLACVWAKPYLLRTVLGFVLGEVLVESTVVLMALETLPGAFAWTHHALLVKAEELVVCDRLGRALRVTFSSRVRPAKF